MSTASRPISPIVRNCTSASTFEELFARYDRPIYLMCLSMAHGDVSKAEDLIQDVRVKILCNAHTFKGECAFETWVHSIARNLAINNFRKAKARGKAVSIDTARPLADIRSWSTLERINLERAFQSLPEEDRTLATLRMVEGFSYDNIARTTGTTSDHVRSRLHKIRLVMRELVSKGAPGDFNHSTFC